MTLGSLTLDASGAKYGYTFSGQGLTLDNGAAGATPATVANASGTNTIASVVTLATDAELQTMNGNELRITGGITGDGDLGVNKHVVTNAGQVNLEVSPNFTGKVTTGSGRVVMDDLSFIQSPDQLTLGVGTFLYTGPSVEIPGFQLKGRSGQPCVFQHDADITVNSLTNIGTSAFLKIGKGKFHLKGTDTLAVNTYVNNSGTGLRTTVYPNGDGPTKAHVRDGSGGRSGERANADNRKNRDRHRRLHVSKERFEHLHSEQRHDQPVGAALPFLLLDGG